MRGTAVNVYLVCIERVSITFRSWMVSHLSRQICILYDPVHKLAEIIMVL